MDDEPTSSHRPGDSAASRRMCGSADSTASDSDTADDAPLLASGSQTVRIDMPASEKPASPHDRFPKERSKALASMDHVPAINDGGLIAIFDALRYHDPGTQVLWLRSVNFLCAQNYGLKCDVLECRYWRGLRWVGVGLNVRGKYTLCGDYIYSGHTIVLVVSALFIGEYSPRRWRILHIFSWLVALVGVVFLVISRGHYTLDVILSYFICTRVFWNYHTMVAHPTIRLSTQNHHRKEFWFPLFRWMECNVLKPIPRRFDCPLPMGRMRSVFRRRVANARIE
ncbi:hypothetical protein OSTOST_10407 [Ostertagia ostertagi]